jgi:membrane protease YdiL (CAAX protease family)
VVQIFIVLICLIYFSLNGSGLPAIAVSRTKSLLTNKSLVYVSPRIILQNATTIFTVILFLKGGLKNRIKDLKLSIRADSKILFSSGVFTAFVSITIITLLGLIVGITKFENQGFSSISQILNALVISVLVFISVSFGEEIMFRGYVLKKLLESGSKPWAILMSAFIFMIYHVGTYSKLFDFIDVFIAGILLACMYIKTNSLWLSIGFHFMWDFSQSFIVRIEDQPQAAYKALLQFTVPKDVYIHGIDLGCKFEIIFIIIEIILILLLFYKMSKIKVNNLLF